MYGRTSLLDPSLAVCLVPGSRFAVVALSDALRADRVRYLTELT